MTSTVSKLFVIVAGVLALGGSGVTPAGAASSRVESACAGDVRRLCPRDKKDSPALRYCMEAKGQYLSRRCVRALEDAGEVPRGYFDKH